MKLINRNRSVMAALLMVASMPVYMGIGNCGTNQPKTVAGVLTSMGNIKRKERAAGQITAQQDADISRKLDSANRSYSKFVKDEQARLAAGTPDPSARTQALHELRSLLSGLSDPSLLGIKSTSAVNEWNAGIATLNTILAGLGG